MTTLEEVAAELYRLPASEFTARRKARAAELRGDDRGLGDEVARLPKPVVAAWAIDVFAHESADELDELLDLGAQLRKAQQSLSRDRMRSLTAQAHTVVERVVSDVARVAAQAGGSLGDSVLRQVEQTLRAAMADEAAADAVRAGLLAKPLEAGGFGPVDLGGAVVGTPRPAPARPRKPAAQQDDDRAERRQQAEQAVEEAESRLRGAEKELGKEKAELASAEQDRVAAETQVAELRAELKQSEQGQAEATTRARAATRAAEKAEKRQHAAQRALDDARAALEKVSRG